MLGEYIDDKELCQICEDNSVMNKNENCLFDKLVNYSQNSIKSSE